MFSIILAIVMLAQNCVVISAEDLQSSLAEDILILETETAAETTASMDDFLTYIRENAAQYRDIGITARDSVIGLSTCVAAQTNGRVILFGRLEGQTGTQEEGAMQK